MTSEDRRSVRLATRSPRPIRSLTGSGDDRVVLRPRRAELVRPVAVAVRPVPPLRRVVDQPRPGERGHQLAPQPERLADDRGVPRVAGAGALLGSRVEPRAEIELLALG